MKSSIRRSVALMSIAVLFLVSPCAAIFEYMWFVNYECDPPGLPGHHVWRVYVEFTDPGDRLTGVFGSPSSPATITSSGGFYQQHPFGGNLAPEVEAVTKAPEVEWDTFCTIGVAVDDGTDQTSTSAAFPQLPVLNHMSMSWFVTLAGYAQGAPDASGRVLIAQLTLLPGSSITNFRVGFSYRPAGSQTSVFLYDASPVLLPLSAGDLDRDLQIDMDDLLMVINGWGATGPGIPDPTDDGVVDIDDLMLVIDQWGFFTGTCS